MTPFLKWAGGKRWLVSDTSFRFPEFSGRYIEPFLGGGAVYFHLRPERAFLSDINPRLIEVYSAIQSDWKKVEKELRRLHTLHTKNFYYQERSRARRTEHTRAAQFLYLNRTCWNGLYRENLKGQFNVPIGTKTQVIIEGEDFSEISVALRGAKLACRDFEPAIKQAKRGDLVFLDPPYTTAHNLNGFVKYNQKIFSWEDQVRLKECVDVALGRGAKVVLTNADHESIHELYKNAEVCRSMSRASVISGSSQYRRTISEAVYVFE